MLTDESCTSILALFGEQFARQFTSESLTWADHLLFAMVPLGIISAITGAIRVQGPQIVRSFIGRARENRALAEFELMSSTSQEVCELFNGTSIIRAMGKPKIAQFLIFPDKYDETVEKYRKYDGSWKEKASACDSISEDDAAQYSACGIHSLTRVVDEKTTFDGKTVSNPPLMYCTGEPNHVDGRVAPLNTMML